MVVSNLHVGAGTVTSSVRAGRGPGNYIIPLKLRPIVSKQFSGSCIVTYGLCWDTNPDSHLHSSVAYVM